MNNISRRNFAWSDNDNDNDDDNDDDNNDDDDDDEDDNDDDSHRLFSVVTWKIACLKVALEL